MIKRYFKKVEEKFSEICWLIKAESIEYDMISDEMGIIKGRISFIDGSVFDFRELASKKEIDYRFQYMNKDMELIMRWDNAPHHREIRTFPYHLHTIKKVKSSPKMSLVKVLDIIAMEVVKGL